MLGTWLAYLGVATVVAVAGTMATKGGRKWLNKKRAQVGRRTAKASRDAWRAWRESTPRGRMRAERRRQPHRLTFGHRRPRNQRKQEKQGPRLPARLAGKASESARLAWANRKRRSLLELVTPGTLPSDPSTVGRCWSRRTTTGHRCRNLCMVGRNYCHEHKPFWAA